MTYDADFVDRLRQREPAACTTFVFNFTPILEAKLRNSFRDQGTVEDLRNDTFYRVFAALDRLREPERIGGFVLGVCRRVILEHYRRIRYTEPLQDDLLEASDGHPPIDEVLLEAEIKALVRDELGRLREDDRKLIEENFEGRDRQEMARDRCITVIGVNVRLSRALKRLRSRILQKLESYRTVANGRGNQC
jgi:RNA polymerase sigma factor (sigma-70 family)